MKRVTLLVTAVLLYPNLGIAQAPSPGCSVEISAPAANTQVGSTVQVTGSASVPSGTRLWVFAHRKDLGVVWPQGGGSANIGNGQWKVLVFIGLPRDIGSEFEIMARVVDDKENQELEGWVKEAAKTGQYNGIPMPSSHTGCTYKPDTVVVKKAS